MADKIELAKKWLEISDEDLKIAELAFLNGIYSQSMFHLQQSIEKSLKGLIVLLLNTDPPYTHDLVRLLRELKLNISYKESLEKDFTELNPFYTASRYPSYKINLSKNLSKEKVLKYSALAKEIKSWLEEKTKS